MVWQLSRSIGIDNDYGDKTSDIIEEAVTSALTGGFIYYLDEQDEEWLGGGNEEA